MDAERIRAYLLTLPHAVETMQWGANLVFWIGDKAIGGKMFTVLNLNEGSRSVLSYSVGPERYAELLEVEGIFPAPYMARIHWVSVERWDVFRPAEWERQLQQAHAITLDKLPPKVRATLVLPAKEQKLLIAESRKRIAAKAKAKKP
jgi:predicted DNA-binding protein (MmcQ/YjbR family)